MSRSDKELLQLSAKAAGYDIETWFDDGIQSGFLAGRLGRPVWNPLADSGDALRLAVELGMTIHTNDGNLRARSVLVQAGTFLAQIDCHTGGGHLAATRRAVVQVAALIGMVEASYVS